LLHRAGILRAVSTPTLAGRLSALWGLIGVEAVLVHPQTSLMPLAWEALRSDLQPIHFAFLAVWVPFMLWSEGYRGFHCKFSPRTAARAGHLMHNPTWRHGLLAPLYAMALLHARRSTFIARVVLLTGIVGLIVGVQQLPAPWRGLVDVGVVLGLGWGALSLAWHGTLTLLGKPPEFDLALPGSVAPPRKSRWPR